MHILNFTNSFFRLSIGILLCWSSLNLFKKDVSCDICQSSQDSCNSEVTLHDIHPCETCLKNKQNWSHEKSPSSPPPEQKHSQLNIFASDDTNIIKNLHSSSKDTCSFGRVALLTSQTIYLEVLFPPPDHSFPS